MSATFDNAVTHIVQLVNDFDWTKCYYRELHSEFGDVQPVGWDWPENYQNHDEQHNPCPQHGIFEFEFEPPDTDLVVNCTIDTMTRELRIMLDDETYSGVVSQEIADAILKHENETFFIAKECRDWILDDPTSFVDSGLSQQLGKNRLIIEMSDEDVWVEWDSILEQICVAVKRDGNGRLDPWTMYEFRITEEQHAAIREAWEKAAIEDD